MVTVKRGDRILCLELNFRSGSFESFWGRRMHDIVDSFHYEFYLPARTLNNGTKVRCLCVCVRLYVVNLQNLICSSSAKLPKTTYLSIQRRYCSVFLPKHDVSQVRQRLCPPRSRLLWLFLLSRKKFHSKSTQLQDVEDIQENAKRQLLAFPKKKKNDYMDLFRQLKRGWMSNIRSFHLWSRLNTVLYFFYSISADTF